VTRSRRELLEVKDLGEIPDFSDEVEEAEFWVTHQFSDPAADKDVMPPHDLLPKPRRRTVPVAVRFDSSTLDRIKAVALRRQKGYQTLLKEFVVERLYEEERREGLIPVRREILKALDELMDRTEARLARQAPEVEETRRERERIWKLLQERRPT
jgi:hypothetical protein